MNDRHFLRRAGALLLSFAAVSVLFSASVTVRPVEAAGDDDAYNQKLVYKWKRVHNYTDLPENDKKAKCLICWADGGFAYCTSGNKMGAEQDDSYFGISNSDIQENPDDKDWDRIGYMGVSMGIDRYLNSAMLGKRTGVSRQDYEDATEDEKPLDTYGTMWAEEFMTTDDRGCWTVETWCHAWGGEDDDEVAGTVVKLYRQDGKQMYADHDNGDNTFFSANASGEDSYVTIITADLEDPTGHTVNMHDGGGFDSGYIAMQVERDGAAIDYYYHWDGSFLANDNFADVGRRSYGESLFVMYICEEPEVMAIKADYTVPTGVTFQFKNDAYLDNGVTLTIEPGAVVSLDGTFFSNGIIRNYGTLILHEGATLAYYDPKKKDASSLYNYGSDHSVECKTINKTLPGEGNVIVMKGARLLLQFADRPSVNAGYVGPSLYFSKGSTLVNYGFISSPFSTRFEGAHIVLNEGSMFLTRVNFEKRLGTLYEVTKDTYNNYSPLNVSTPGVEFVGKANYIEYYGEWKDQKTDMLSTFEADPNVTVRKVR